MITLSDIEILGIKIVALLRSGEFPDLNCITCSKETQEQFNCNLELDRGPVRYHEMLGELPACPLRLISTSVMSFVDEYDFYEKYPGSMPPYGEINPRYWESVKVFESFKHEIRELESKTKDDTDNMVKMQSLVKKNK